jgi:DNA sulfur modification protein DndE
MFKIIKTKKANRELISRLTRQLDLGSENMIARIGICYSLSKDEKLSLESVGDSGGKEYSKNVLLGDYDGIYFAMVATKYDISIQNKDIAKYIKLHLDHGIETIHQEIIEEKNVGFDYILSLISESLNVKTN